MKDDLIEYLDNEFKETLKFLVILQSLPIEKRLEMAFRKGALAAFSRMTGKIKDIDKLEEKL